MVVKKKSRKSNLTAVQIKKFLVRNAGRYSIRMLATTETRYPAYIKKRGQSEEAPWNLYVDSWGGPPTFRTEFLFPQKVVLNAVWGSLQYSIKTKLKLYERCVLSILIYGSECWRIAEYDLAKLSTFHATSLRKNPTHLLAKNHLQP